MMIVRYVDETKQARFQARYGVVEDGHVRAASGDPFTGVEPGETIGTMDDLTLLPPVQPGKIVCVGLNYAAHVTENDASREIPAEPVLFMKPNSALIGHGGTIEIANPANRTDFEAELALVIGKVARDVSEEEAADYVLGITAANDVSDRVLQKQDGQWVRAKGYDTYCPAGPVLVTGVDLTRGDITVESRLNGEVRQSQSTGSMLFSPLFLVSFISRVMTLDPGDLILTGTPENVGPMTPGDMIEVEVGPVGILRNLVAAR